MSEHTPLTEAERIERLLEDHTLSVRTEFGDVAWTGDCTATGCRWTEWGPIGGRAAADRAHRRHIADLLAARTSTATADTDDHKFTPLTEAEREAEVRALTKIVRSTLARITVREDNPYDTSRLVALAVADHLAARTSTATADDPGRQGLGRLIIGLLDKHWPNSGVNGWYLTDLIREQLPATADTGLRERVEALADEWEASDHRTWVSNCGSELRELLDVHCRHKGGTEDCPARCLIVYGGTFATTPLDDTPASTEDRADNEETR